MTNDKVILTISDPVKFEKGTLLRITYVGGDEEVTYVSSIIDATKFAVYGRLASWFITAKRAGHFKPKFFGEL